MWFIIKESKYVIKNSKALINGMKCRRMLDIFKLIPSDILEVPLKHIENQGYLL